MITNSLDEEIEDESGFQYPGDGEKYPWDETFFTLGEKCYKFYSKGK